MKSLLRSIAFYLPQFHAIPENDRWWGTGFTEWTNVRKALPLFPGHHQPHVPGPLGYYDLRSPETREAHAALAREHGIYGFCYYHYWFNGKRLLETPFNEVLRSGKPDFPFCLCWANENWTRRWDGQDQEILMAQKYSEEDDRSLINSLIPAFRDERYIRVNGKPLFILYRSLLLPNPKRTAEIWREELRKAGVGDVYLVRIENHYEEGEPNPEHIGFDAAAEFAPYWGSRGEPISDQFAVFDEFKGRDPLIYDYEQHMRALLLRKKPAYKLFRGAFPSWDNSARRKNQPVVFINSSPEKYAFWLSQIARYTLECFEGDERLLFINAWNEWGEGCHVEPDEKYGLRHLEATRLGLRLGHDIHDAFSRIRPCSGSLPFDPDTWYSILAKVYGNRGELSQNERDLLSSFSSYVLFTMFPLLDKGVQEQFLLSLQAKEREIAVLHNSMSWKITAPLRKIHSMLFR